MLALDLSSENLGISALAVHLPGRVVRPSEYLESAVSFSIEQVRSIWRDTIIEPEHIFRFFTGQMPSADDCDRQVESFTDESGIHLVRIASQPGSDMAVEAAKKLRGLKPGLVRSAGAIIYYSSTLGPQPVCSIPCRLQHELGLTQATAFSVAQKGVNAGFIALKIAAEMSLVENMRAALLIGSECYVPPYQRSLGNIALYGDSSTGAIVSRSTYDFRLLHVFIMDYCILFPGDRSQDVDFGDLIAEKTALAMRESLDSSGVKLENISAVLPPNLNLNALRRVSEKTGIPWQKFYISSLEENGSLGSSDLVANLHHALRHGRFRHGDLILALGISAECSVACAFFLYEPEPNET
jgi:3-oxoacyl-[acyl-carrier-protein] synthase III